MNQYFLFLIGFYFVFSPVQGISQQDDLVNKLWVDGQHFYDKGEFDKAVGVYQKLLSKRSSSEELFYNLGSAYYRLGRKGEAMAALLAKNGVIGAEGMFEGPRGFGNAMSAEVDWQETINNLENDYTITRMTQKNHTCCGHTFAAIDSIFCCLAFVFAVAVAFAFVFGKG